MKNQSAPSPISNTYNSFEIKDQRGANDSMIDFAKMTILYSLNKYPNSDFDKAEFIKNQFKEKYGKIWSCCLLKNGGVSFDYFDYWITIKFNNYHIYIWKASK